MNTVANSAPLRLHRLFGVLTSKRENTVGKKNRRIKNKQFNRFEKGGHHQYVEEFPPPIIKESIYSGAIKCKLVHGLGYSIIIPDFLFLLEETTRWIQPLFFTACSLSKFDDHVECRFAIDISHGQRLFVNIDSTGFIRHYDDGSELFCCKIQGPENLKEYCTGVVEEYEEYHIPLSESILFYFFKVSFSSLSLKLEKKNIQILLKTRFLITH